MVETGDEPDGVAVGSVGSGEVLACIFGGTDDAERARALAVVVCGREGAAEVAGPKEDSRELWLSDGDHVLVTERRGAIATTLRHVARLIELALVDVDPGERVEHGELVRRVRDPLENVLGPLVRSDRRVEITLVVVRHGDAHVAASRDIHL